MEHQSDKYIYIFHSLIYVTRWIQKHWEVIKFIIKLVLFYFISKMLCFNSKLRKSKIHIPKNWLHIAMCPSTNKCHTKRSIYDSDNKINKLHLILNIHTELQNKNFIFTNPYSLINYSVHLSSVNVTWAAITALYTDYPHCNVDPVCLCAASERAQLEDVFQFVYQPDEPVPADCLDQYLPRLDQLFTRLNDFVSQMCSSVSGVPLMTSSSIKLSTTADGNKVSTGVPYDLKFCTLVSLVNFCTRWAGVEITEGGN